MAATIQVLSDHTINQIAAGEVIENPSSIVKELVENALDAGSSKVVIETLGGGLDLIRISDDGCGMSPEDAVLCLERHATSKLKEAEDLLRVMTMGFRGEALASIASISKMTIQTAEENGIGTRIEVEGGVVQSIKPCARTRGTSIEVRQLFYNVPARRKFQKSPTGCASEITKVVTILSLAHPSIGFDLYQQNQEGLKFPRETGDFLASFQSRAKKALGEAFTSEAFLIESTFAPFSLKGIIGSLQNTRPNRSLQYAFVNKRAVLCPFLSFAVKEAFGTRIAEDRFPVYAIHLEIPTSYLDVNVHPQKKEVRFREESLLRYKVQEALQQQLFSKEIEADNPLSTNPVAFNLFSKESFFAKPSQEEPCFVQEELLVRNKEDQDSLQMTLPFERKVHPIGLYESFLWVYGHSAGYLQLDIKPEGIWVVDLQAAGSKILFDSLQQQGPVLMQNLLLPLSFSCSLAEAEEMQARLGELEKWGFSLRSSGKQSFLVEGIPSVLQEAESLDFLRQFLSTEEKGGLSKIGEERKLASICSRQMASRKQSYSLFSALEVLYALAKTKCPLFCPLGNKTIVQIGNDELLQWFAKKR
jgi:DNA mismatch repair protein MutL